MTKRKPKQNPKDFMSFEKFLKNQTQVKPLQKEIKNTKKDNKTSLLAKNNIRLEQENEILKKKVKSLEQSSVENNEKNTTKIDFSKISPNNKDDHTIAKMLKDKEKKEGFEERNY
jgi:regulator of replication initiation timing